MVCHVCGAKIPDGECFCPQCGAGVQASGVVAHDRDAVYAETNAQKPRMRTGVIEPLESLYSARKALVILNGIMIVALLVCLVFFKVNSDYSYEILKGFLNIYPVLVILQNVVVFAVVIWQLFLLTELKSYEVRFGKVVLFMLLGVTLSLVFAFLKKDNIVLVLILGILNTAFDILAYYYLCDAFSALTRPWDGGLADKWSYIFALYYIIRSVDFFCTILINVINDVDERLLLYFLVFIEATAVLAQSVYELVHIKKTVELFKRGADPVTDAVRSK